MTYSRNVTYKLHVTPTSKSGGFAPDGGKPAVPVMGTFVVGDDGKIARWTDYFDLNLTVKLLQGEDISALIPAASAT